MSQSPQTGQPGSLAPPIRVAMLSKALVMPAYRGKLAALAEFDDLDLLAITPPAWPEAGRLVESKPQNGQGYRVEVAPACFIGQFHLHFYPDLAGRLRRFRPDIVHLDEEPYNLATFLALLAAKRVGSRTLFFTWQNLPKRYPWPFGAFERFVLRHVNWAIAGNQAAATIVRRKGFVGPISVIPQFGADPALASSERQRALAARGSPIDGNRPFTVAYAGRLVPEKGVAGLLRACAALDGAWRLKVLGAGPELAALRASAAALGVADRVEFAEPIPSNEMPGWLVGVDALVLPSLTRSHWKEQFGRILVEAMLCEVAVVGSNSGEIPNVIGDAGRIVAEGDDAALTTALAELRVNPDGRVRLAAAGRARALAHFTHARIAAATHAVYREMVDHPWPNPRPRLAPPDRLVR